MLVQIITLNVLVNGVFSIKNTLVIVNKDITTDKTVRIGPVRAIICRSVKTVIVVSVQKFVSLGPPKTPTTVVSLPD